MDTKLKGLSSHRAEASREAESAPIDGRRIDGAHVSKANTGEPIATDSVTADTTAEVRLRDRLRGLLRVRNDRMIGVVAAGLTPILRMHGATISVRIEAWSPEFDPRLATAGCIYPIWHEAVLLAALKFAKNPYDVNILVSESRDGQYIAEVLRRLKLNTVRGSSSHGGVKALRELMRSITTGHLVLMPDGPRGPRRSFQTGALYLASRTQAPIVPVGIAFSRAWRMNTWDQFVLPQPFSRAAMYLGEPVYIPKRCSAEELENFRPVVCEAMNHAEETAQELLT